MPYALIDPAIIMIDMVVTDNGLLSNQHQTTTWLSETKIILSIYHQSVPKEYNWLK